MNNNEELYENEVFTLTDEEGNESQFEMLGALELDGNSYVALVPCDGDEDEYVILKVTYDEDESEVLVTIDDDDEFDKVADAFEDEFMSEFDCDENGFSVEETEDSENNN